MQLSENHSTISPSGDNIVLLSLIYLTVLVGVPVKAAAVGGGGEEKLGLAQGEALGDPRPDVPHLLGTDDFRRESVGVQRQVHVTPGNTGERRRETANNGERIGEDEMT